MSSPSHDELNNWIPWKLSGSLCQWIYIGNKKFTEPFFNDTISACRNFEENCKPFKVFSDLKIMEQWSEDVGSLTPTAIIFHVSRCGSTLLSQLLCLDKAHIVLSEVPLFDELLRTPYKKNTTISIDKNYIKAAINLYCMQRDEKEKRVFIKTDSWHLHFYKELRNLFPSMPFIFLYRNPGEIILSQQKQRGMQSVPGLVEPEVFGFSAEQINNVSLDLYMAKVLESYFKKMIEIKKADRRVLLFNYKEGMNNILKKISVYLGLNITVETEKLLYERSRFHAKHPQQLFEEEQKEVVQPVYLSPAFELYQQLEDVRLCQSPAS